MKKYLKYVITILILTVVIFEAIVFGILAQKKNVFHDSYQSLIVDKYRALENTDEKKIIIVSGSSSAFGLRQDMLEEATGYKVVNLGVHAGFGQLFHTELAKENINEGDIVLLGYEYNWFRNFDNLGQQLIMSGIDNNIDMYKHIPIKYWKAFIGYLFKYASDKNSYGGAGGLYSREAFSENGQMTWLRDYALTDYSEKVDLYEDVNVLDENGKVSISDTTVKNLSDFKKYVEKHGASVYFIAPPVLDESVTCSTDNLVELAELEEETIGIPYISDPRLYIFPKELMANSIYHCNNEGEKVRTSILIDDLKLSGIINSDEVSKAIKNENGETFALVDSFPKRFIHKPQTVDRVYAVDSNGNETQFTEGVDYIIDYFRGTIRRTECSKIPNYSEHKVIFSSGKFVYDSDNNPEKNKKYQIKVDYKYFANEKELEPIDDKSIYLSEKLRNKMLEGKGIKIALCGDSIALGADTNGKDIYLNYLKDEIEHSYGINVETKNFSEGGRSSDLLFEKMSGILEMNPDMVIVEFGMNDHCNFTKNDKEAINKYKSNIESFVHEMKKRDIDVIIVGFFQQNISYIGEDMNVSKMCNDVLKEIAEENKLFFVDVYPIFEKVSCVKPLCSDVTADYIHHPTEWGQKLYFTKLIEVFNLKQDMKPINIPNYIFVN